MLPLGLPPYKIREAKIKANLKILRMRPPAAGDGPEPLKPQHPLSLRYTYSMDNMMGARCTYRSALAPSSKSGSGTSPPTGQATPHGRLVGAEGELKCPAQSSLGEGISRGCPPCR